jgi:hypothetical protein
VARPGRAGPVRRSGTRAQFGLRIVGVVFAVGIMIAVFAMLDVAPDLDAMLLRLSLGIPAAAVAVAVAIGLAVRAARLAAVEREWYADAFGSSEERVLETLDQRYLVDLASLATTAPRSADLAFGTIAYRYPYLPDPVVGSLVARARERIGETIPAPIAATPVPPSPSLGFFARLAGRTSSSGRQRIRSTAKAVSIIALVVGVLVFFPLASIAESALLQCTGVLLVAASAGLFALNSHWSSTWIPRADYREAYGSDPERVLDAGSPAFAAQLVDAAGDGSMPVFPAAALVRSRFPMVAGFDAVDVVRAAQRRLRG